MAGENKSGTMRARLKSLLGSRSRGIEPVDIAQALKKEAQNAKKVFRQGAYVPDTYEVQICKQDYDGFKTFLSVVRQELEQDLASFFNRKGFILNTGTKLEVRFRPSSVIAPGTIRVYSHFADALPRDNPKSGPVLIFHPDSDKKQPVRIGDGVHVAGRGRNCDIAVPGSDPLMSGTHFSIEVCDQGVFVLDLGSANGTLVNDSPIIQKTRLDTGDRITAGNTVIEVAF